MKLCALGAAALVLTGCATPGIEGRAWTPQIDPRGVNQASYEKDLEECRAAAASNPNADGNKEAGRKAIKYGAMGAAAMGLAAVATGGIALLPLMAGSMVTTGGAAAATGAMSGKVAGDVKYQGIVANCLNGRGYKVLG